MLGWTPSWLSPWQNQGKRKNEIKEADPDGPFYYEELLLEMNNKLNTLVEAVIAQDRPLFDIQP